MPPSELPPSPDALPQHKAVVPHRQFTITTIDRTCYITMPAWWQRLGVIAIALFLVLMAAVSWSYHRMLQQVAINDAEILQAGDAYQASIAHFAEHIARLRDSTIEIQRNSAAAQEELRNAAQERHEQLEAATAENVALHRRIAALWVEIGDMRTLAEERRRGR